MRHSHQRTESKESLLISDASFNSSTRPGTVVRWRRLWRSRPVGPCRAVTIKRFCASQRQPRAEITALPRHMRGQTNSSVASE